MKKIIKKNKSKGSIPIVNTKILQEDKIIIDFSLFYFPSINCKFFTNKLKTTEEYIKAMSSIYHSTLPYITSYKFSELEKINKHCHIIRNTEEAFDNIVKVLTKYRECFPEFEFSNVEEEVDEFYQLAGQSGARLICKRVSNNIFMLLFIDFHHLIYKNKIFDKDYKNYNYLEEDIYVGNINILNIEDCISDKCLECDELKN